MSKMLTPRQESRIPIYKNSEDHCHKTEPGTIRLTPPKVRKLLAIISLGFESAVEVEVYDAHGDVINNL